MATIYLFSGHHCQQYGIVWVCGLCIVCQCCFSVVCSLTRNTPQESLQAYTSRGLLTILSVLRTRQALNIEYCCLLMTLSIKPYFQGCDQRKHSSNLLQIGPSMKPHLSQMNKKAH